MTPDVSVMMSIFLAFCSAAATWGVLQSRLTKAEQNAVDQSRRLDKIEAEMQGFRLEHTDIRQGISEVKAQLSKIDTMLVMLVQKHPHNNA